jgi:prepilin-type processing-associated H-X9-DG protein
MRQNIALYLGGKMQYNTSGKSYCNNYDFWKKWLVCPSRSGGPNADVLVHFYTGTPVAGEYMVEGEYMYWGGAGYFGLPCKYRSDYQEIGWYKPYFLNSHHPIYKLDHPLTKAAENVLMSDINTYQLKGTKKVYYEAWSYYKPNHGWFKGTNRPAGQNMLYLDGHVKWIRDPWQNGIERFAGGRGTMNW